MGSHSHRSQFGEKNKPFKGKSKGKSKRKYAGRVESGVKTVSVSSESGKSDRLNHQRQVRDQKRHEAMKKKRIGSHHVDAPPRIIGVIGLHELARPRQPRELLASFLDDSTLTQSEAPCTFKAPFQNKETCISIMESTDLVSALDIAKVADILVLVLHPTVENECGVDAYGDHLVTLLCSQGMPTIIPVVQGLFDSMHSKAAVKHLEKQCVRYIHDVFGSLGKKISKMYHLDQTSDVPQLLRAVRELKQRDVRWRDDRCYLLAEASQQSNGILSITGYLRGPSDQKLSADRLVHVTGYGDYCVNQVRCGHSGLVLGERNEATAETLEGLNMNPDVDEDLELVEDEELDAAIHAETGTKRVGDHRAVWEEALGLEPSEQVEQDTMEDEDMDVAKSKLRLERDEKEFPDEVETPLDAPAREHFSAYRGLDDFQRSEWDADGPDALPDYYKHIYQFEQLAFSEKRAREEAQQGCCSPGSKVTLCLRVPDEQGLAMIANHAHRPLIVSALFRHERKVSLLHMKVKRYEGFNGYEEPVENDEELEIHCGFRRFTAAPVYSQDAMKATKFKVDKFFHQGQFSIASVFGRIMFGHPNVLMFRNNQIVATGALSTIAPERLLIERIVLTGYPLRVNKRHAVCRFMFFSPEDVRWFRPIALRTKFGLRGCIEEPVGTKGLFKCSFSDFIKHHDTICMNLYRRVFPPFAMESFQ